VVAARAAGHAAREVVAHAHAGPRPYPACHSSAASAPLCPAGRALVDGPGSASPAKRPAACRLHGDRL